MGLTDERSGFRERLRQALLEAQLSHLQSTSFAREFNARYSGTPISVNTARKWLLADVLPQQEKLQALAAWLGVRTEWLCFGSGPQRAASGTARGKEFDLENVQILADLKRLDAHHRKLAREFVKMLLRDLSPKSLGK